MKSFLRGLGLAIVVLLSIAAWAVLPWTVLLAVAVLFFLWMQLTRVGRQAGSATGVGISTLPQRIGSSSVVVVGIAGVVAVLVSLLAMGVGYQETLSKSGSADTAIVMRGGSASEVSSVLDHASVTAIAEAPGIARDAAGKPIASPELVVAANLPLKDGSGDEGSVQVRGVGEQAWTLRPEVKIVAGRKFKPGLRELVAGKGAQRQFAGLQPGHEIKLGSQTWTVVGIFDSGNALGSELWGDADIIGSAYRRGSSRTSVFVRLTDASAFDAFKVALSGDPRLQVDVDTTLHYFSKQSESFTKVISIIGMIVGGIMGIGAVFGALNTMFAAVATRAREIATLRAIGFRGPPVVVAVMLETMLLAALGGLLGGLIAWALFNGYSASTLTQGTVGSLNFELAVTPALLWTGLKWALAIGFIGGLFPAVRAARLPVTTALRES
ncbi:ABC transporter permease [Frateuria hangzhouensis]|uniref:ABC transporter permease n=1 Tax=Frateuria hangzhouensis TaxID=2995589 RepID=UPI002260D693|nr:ABC transporter permease [Frateuria sp. STR12]MCX7515054.1 ABC transporter permease [Frateuria sp. STR12]